MCAPKIDTPNIVEAPEPPQAEKVAQEIGRPTQIGSRDFNGRPGLLARYDLSLPPNWQLPR